MAESVKDKSPCTPDLMSPTSSVENRRVKRPDRKRFQNDLDRINNGINTKENELKCLQAKNNSETFQSRLRTLRQEKEDAVDRRRKMDERLLTVNKEITNKRDGMSRVHSTLKYKSEEWINEAIKRLEYQLRVHNFTLKEEKTIVKEIDSLNRSRRNLREYLIRKTELDAMAKEQEGMRNDRDALFKKVTSLKIDEEKIKKEHSEVRIQCDKLKQELDSLYRQKRTLVSEFRKISNEYNQQRIEQRQSTRKKTDDEPKDDEKENDAALEKFSEENRLCDTLLTYLQRFDVRAVSQLSFSSLDTCDSVSDGNTPVSPLTSKADVEEGFVLLKKDEGEWYCVGAKGTHGKRNMKREKKRQLQQQKKKCITHTPEIFHQFERLSLKPPTSITEIPVTIEQLKAKKKYLQHLSTTSSPATPSSAEFPLYTFAQDTPRSPVRDAVDVSAENETETLSASTETVTEQPTNRNSATSEVQEEEEPKESRHDYKLKRANFRLALRPSYSKDKATIGALTNGSSDSPCSLTNGFGDKNGNATDVEDDVINNRQDLVFRKRDIVSLPGHSQQRDMEVQ